jgi:hypothetical protein
MITVISLGAGVQSTTMALMAKHGEIEPMPDCAIFADTQWEPKAVYQHLDWLETVLPFPVHRVTAGNLRAILMDGHRVEGRRFANLPWYIRNPDGSEGIGRRQCTKDYKLRPIQRKIVELMGGKRPKGGAVSLIGISSDEIMRMKPSRVQYNVNRWPLIEKRMSRGDCIEWLMRHQYRIPGKSACIGCPYHSAAQWRSLNAEEFADACEVDETIRHHFRMKGEQYMHRSLKPLSEVDFSTAEDRGQLNLFINECEGMCGV